MDSKWNTSQRSILSQAVILAGFGMFGVWSYWPTLAEIARTWSKDPQYSHGYLVPIFAAALLWRRRDRLAAVSPCTNWWGMLLLAGGACLRLVGTGLYFEWLEGISLLPCLAGFALLFGGWPALRWAWPAIGFLAFMVPLPYQLKMAMGLPLQRIATVASGYLMQTLGLPAVPEGNTILLSGVKLGIAEACSGLGMLLTFLAVATIVAVVIHRPWWERIVVLVSAIPIALIANLVRITVTGVLHETAGHAVANRVFHDWGGWLMMVLALGLLWLELAFLARLFLEPLLMTPVPLTARPTSGTRELDSRARRSRSPGRPLPI